MDLMNTLFASMAAVIALASATADAVRAGRNSRRLTRLLADLAKIGGQR